LPLLFRPSDFLLSTRGWRADFEASGSIERVAGILGDSPATIRR
jgi:hypothetical protein